MKNQDTVTTSRTSAFLILLAVMLGFTGCAMPQPQQHGRRCQTVARNRNNPPLVELGVAILSQVLNQAAGGNCVNNGQRVTCQETYQETSTVPGYVQGVSQYNGGGRGGVSFHPQSYHPSMSGGNISPTERAAMRPTVVRMIRTGPDSYICVPGGNQQLQGRRVMNTGNCRPVQQVQQREQGCFQPPTTRHRQQYQSQGRCEWPSM